MADLIYGENSAFLSSMITKNQRDSTRKVILQLTQATSILVFLRLLVVVK